jgi:LmbE family N-acetylglucosaminyl deacetylase
VKYAPTLKMISMSENNQNSPGIWNNPQKIQVILAHPDDPEFFCGGTLSRWVQAGHEIDYVLFTNGNKGGPSELSSDELCGIRQREQKNAAQIIGVRKLTFLGLEDGYLLPSLDLRREIVRIIRREKPDILVTCDPTLLYSWNGRINHPDHRAAGQIVLDAIFPAAGNGHFFPELLSEEGLEPHTPREIWVSLAVNPNVTIDVTETWGLRLKALKMHESQTGNPDQFEQRMRARHTEDSTDQAPRFEEKFRVLYY